MKKIYCEASSEIDFEIAYLGTVKFKITDPDENNNFTIKSELDELEFIQNLVRFSSDITYLTGNEYNFKILSIENL